MELYDFTLKFALGQHDADPDAFTGRLESEGCDDALVGVGQRGRIALNFAREAISAKEAILSAIHDVRRAIPDAGFVEATPDLVGLSDMAQLLGFSRQYMRKLMEESGSEFPLPVHDGKRPIWHLGTVLQWLMNRRGRTVNRALLEVAIVNRQCNYVKEQVQLDGEIAERLRDAIAA